MPRLTTAVQRSESRWALPFKVMMANREIHDLQSKIAASKHNVYLLQKTVREFSKLAFDKLALESTCEEYTRTDLADFQIVRVFLERTKATSKYFDAASAPVSKESRPSKKLRRLRNGTHNSSWYVYLTLKEAQAQLASLQVEYCQLKERTVGIKDVIRRFEEDNKALRHDIALLYEVKKSGKQTKFAENTWAKLADVGVPGGDRRSIDNARRMSALSFRRMSMSSTKGAPFISAPQTGVYGDLDDYQFPPRQHPNRSSRPTSGIFDQGPVVHRPTSRRYSNSDAGGSTSTARYARREDAIAKEYTSRKECRSIDRTNGVPQDQASKTSSGEYDRSAIDDESTCTSNSANDSSYSDSSLKSADTLGAIVSQTSKVSRAPRPHSFIACKRYSSYDVRGRKIEN